MSGKHEIVYWDACLFISHLKGEERRDPLDMQGVKALVKKIDKSEIHLATSVITMTEILESVMPANAKEKLDRFFQRRSCHLIDVNKSVNIPFLVPVESRKIGPQKLTAAA